jgi:cytochrome b561
MGGENNSAKVGIYDAPTVILHWITAALVAVLWVTGQTTGFLPRGPWQQSAWSIHVLLGFALGGVLSARIIWRAGLGRDLPAADPGLLHVIAKVTHYLLYVLLVIVVSLGVANALVRGLTLFGTWHLPQVGDPGLRRTINGWHALAANGVFVLARIHAAAALTHYYLWRDGVLGRMLPARGKERNST